MMSVISLTTSSATSIATSSPPSIAVLLINVQPSSSALRDHLAIVLPLLIAETPSVPISAISSANVSHVIPRSARSSATLETPRATSSPIPRRTLCNTALRASSPAIGRVPRLATCNANFAPAFTGFNKFKGSKITSPAKPIPRAAHFCQPSPCNKS